MSGNIKELPVQHDNEPPSVVPGPVGVSGMGDASLQEDKPWQSRLLPFMVGSLLLMGVLFFAATLWDFHRMEQSLAYEVPAVLDVLTALEKNPLAAGDATYRDWHVRAILESNALTHKYKQYGAVVHARIWTRYMGFLTGMVLALSGCVFILGKLREGVRVSGEGSGLKGSLETTSPGVALVAAGSILVGISLYVKVTLETVDTPIYLPRLVEAAAKGTSVVTTDPSPLSSGHPATDPKASLPEDVKRELGEQAEKDAASPAK